MRRDREHMQTEAALEALGRADRAAAPAGLEDRVFAASAGLIRERPAVVARIGPSAGVRALRIAAAVGVIGGVALVARLWTGTGSTLEAAALDSDIASWLQMERSGMFETQFGLAVEGLIGDTEDALLDDPWADDAFADAFAEGSAS